MIDDLTPEQARELRLTAQLEIVKVILEYKGIPLEEVRAEGWKVNPKTRKLSFHRFAHNPDGEKIIRLGSDSLRSVRQSVTIPKQVSLELF